jgi:hypothetical protein
MKAMILRAMVLYFLLWIFRRKTSPVEKPLEDADNSDASFDANSFLTDKEL